MTSYHSSHGSISQKKSPSRATGSPLNAEQRPRSQKVVPSHSSKFPSMSPSHSSRSHSMASYSSPSPVRFSSLSSDFLLPTRSSSSHQSPHLLATATAIASNASISEAESSSHPLFRRHAAAALATANRMRVRRGSMLGREVASNSAAYSSSDGDEDMESDDEPRSSYAVPVHPESLPLQSSKGLADFSRDQDDVMQMETGEVSLESVKLDSKSRPNTPPPGQHFSYPTDNTSYTSSPLNRKVLGRKASTAPRDRDVLRVAASLKDEARPSDSEIASEAKLQRKLGPESESLAPSTPRLLAIGAPSPTHLKRSYFTQHPPFGTATDPIVDEDDLHFHEHFEAIDRDDSSDEEDPSYFKASIVVPRTEDEQSASSYSEGIAIPAPTQKEQLWKGFRESTPVRNSPGTERVFARGKTATTLSSSFGSSSHPDSAMDFDHLPSVGKTIQPSSTWGKTTTKRKFMDERFEPYSLQKRRAVSPVTLISTTNANPMTTVRHGVNRARSSTPTTTISPSLYAVSQISPLSIQNASSGASNMLPTPTPLSIPSPTLSSSRSHSGFSKSVPGLTTSTKTFTAFHTVSPVHTRPSTPTNQVVGFHGTTNSPSLIHGGPGTKPTTPGASSSSTAPNTNGGSGPGYGSGALGLSLGSANNRFKEEQQEQEEEGMLGHVSAIRLGEM